MNELLETLSHRPSVFGARRTEQANSFVQWLLDGLWGRPPKEMTRYDDDVRFD
ncbi:MAG: hypothetical protein AAGL10_03820 [Pseudomonadota bacterium]